jgi:hypothetical protein
MYKNSMSKDATNNKSHKLAPNKTKREHIKAICKIKET